MTAYRRGRSEVVVGLYAMSAMAVFALMFGTLTSRGLIRKTTDLYIRLSSADGLLRGDAVLFRGVPVGEVRTIAFDDATGDVVVRSRLHRSVPLTRSSTATLVPVDMFGRQAVELRAGSASAPPLADGDTLPGIRPPALTDRLDAVGHQVERVVGDTTIELVRQALAGVGGAGSGLTAVSHDISTFLARQSRDLEEITAATGIVLRNLSSVTDSAELAALRGELAVAMTALGNAAARMDSTTAVAAQVLGRLERGEGALGRALNDPALYDRATGAVTQLELLLADIRANPGRYVTVKVF